jgi:hypothetical protein
MKIKIIAPEPPRQANLFACHNVALALGFSQLAVGIFPQSSLFAPVHPGLPIAIVTAPSFAMSLRRSFAASSRQITSDHVLSTGMITPEKHTEPQAKHN